MKSGVHFYNDFPSLPKLFFKLCGILLAHAMTIQSIPPERRRIKHYLLALIVGISLKELTSALLVVAFIKEHVRTADAKGLYDIFFQPERRHKSLYALFTAHSDKVKISCNRTFEMGRYILLAVIAELFQCSAGMPKLNYCRFLTLFAGSHRHKIVAYEHSPCICVSFHKAHHIFKPRDHSTA